MNPAIRTLGLILSLSLVFACKKNSNDPDPGNKGPKLSKVIVWTSASLMPTIIKQITYTYKYNYNADNLPVDCAVSNNSVYPYPVKMKFYYTN